MESYFTRNISDTGRFFFIFGHTKDRFCEDNLVDVDLEHLLYKHFKDIGYERIIFYSKDDKLYFYDRDSFDKTKQPDEVLKESAAKPKAMEKPAAKSNRLQGPIFGEFASSVKKSGQNHAFRLIETPVKANADKLHFDRMDENLAFERINYCVKNVKIKTAVVFTNADDFIKYFVRSIESIESHVFDSFNQYDGLGPDNHNIVLFIFPKGAQSVIASKYRDTFFEGKITEANTVIINTPASAEIRNAINHYRLMHGLKVDFTCLDAICRRIVRELCKASRPLEWLMFALKPIIENNIVLDTDRCDAMFGKKDNETAMQKLGRLVGMENVKDEIRMLESRKESDEKPATDEKHRSRILPPALKVDETYNLHYVITGNPGTGKTTAARLLGEIMYESGYLESGHTVEVSYNDLVSQYNPGDTAVNTNRQIESAMGGVLFIDEAYTLAPSDEQGGGSWGQIAIDTILKAMSDRNGHFSVVVAGYPDKMKVFIDSNPGLKRRFLKTIHIDDYEPDELLQIFYYNLHNNVMRKKYIAGGELSTMLSSFLVNWHKSRDDQWGNAGEIEKLLQEMDGNWYKRKGEKSAEGELILDIRDIPDNLRKYCKPAQEAKEDAVKKLEKLIGLQRAKEKIEELKINIAFEGKTEPGHYIFAGSPGTGKTTVARLFGNILREEGVLRRGHVVEVKREDLVAGYVGQTAPKTKEKLTEALNGILFIDEAYTLAEGGENDFGKEAINTMLAFMEDEVNRNRICVICAGYTKDMERFVQSNSGLKSRFTEIIHFDDYNANELIEILHSFGAGYTMEKDYIQKSREIFEIWIKNKGDDFGNAREVRNYFNECKTTQRKRLITEYGNIVNIPEDIKNVLTVKDIPLKYMSVDKSRPAATDNLS